MSTQVVPLLIGGLPTGAPPLWRVTFSGTHVDSSDDTTIITAFASSTSSVGPSPVGIGARPVDDTLSTREPAIAAASPR
jgi:hypothetical protein